VKAEPEPRVRVRGASARREVLCGGSGVGRKVCPAVGVQDVLNRQIHSCTPLAWIIHAAA
jgi:hypothetical protein